MRGWLWVFSLTLVAHSIITVAYLWAAANAQNLTLFGFRFSSIWGFLLAYSALTAVLFYPANYLFAYAYWYGYNVVFPGKAWRVQELSWLASILVMFIVAWLYLGELPTKNAILALTFLVCALLVILWR